MSDENMYSDVNLDEVIPNQDSSAKPEESIHQELDNELNAQVQQSMFAAGQKNPDQHAKVMTLAESFGARSDFVEANYDALRARKEQMDVGEKLANSSPKLKEFLTDPDTAAITKDDLDSLSQIEKEVEKRNFADDAWTALKVGGFKLNAMVAKTPGYLANVALVPENIWHRYQGEPQKYFPIENDVSRRYDQAAESLMNEAPALSKSAVTELTQGNYAEAGKIAALQIIQNFPQQIAILGSMATGVGEAGLIGAGLTTAAEKAGDLQKQGVEPLQAVNVAATHGVIEAAFERLGTGGVLKSWENAAVKEFGKQAGREFTFNFGKQLAYTVASEANEEFATSLAQDFTDYISGVNPDAMKGSLTRAFDAGLIGMGSSLTTSVPTGFTAGYAKFNQLRQIENNQRFYKALGDTAEKSKMRERLPSKMGEYVDHLTQDGPVQTIYMNAEGFTEFFQKKDMSAAEIAKQLGITDSYNKALETGADIEIPTSVMAEKLATPEYKEIYDGLAPHVKFNPEDATPFEIEQQKKDAAESIKAEYEKAKEGKTDEQVVKNEASAKEVGKDIETQLKENNGFSPKAAKAQAKLYEEFFKIQGMKSGTDPLELYKKYGLNVRSLREEQALEGDITYNQPQHLMAHKLMLGVVKVGDKLTVNPAAGVEASGSITDSEAGKTFVVDKFTTNKVYTGVSSDMITSLERSAAAQGASTMMTSTTRLGITPESPVFKMYTDAGFTPSTVGNETVLVKKLAKPQFYNESRYYQSKPNAMGFVSKLEQTIEDKMSASQDVNSLKAMLKEIKPEEMKWSGLDEFLKGKEKVKKEDVLNFLKANQLQIEEVTKTGDTSYSKYVLPEGENYREVLFRMPPSQLGAYKLPESYQDIKNWNHEQRLSWTATPKSEVEADPTFIKEKKALAKKVKKEHPEMKPKAINSFIDQILIVPKIDESTINNASDELVSSFKELHKLYNKLRYPHPKEDIYKIRNPDDNSNYVIYNNNRSDTGGSWYIGAHRKGDQKFFNSFNEAVADLERSINQESENKRPDTFKSSHFDENNILAHTRLNERTDADGKKVLFVEEIQSDWHQAGRKKGYRETVDHPEQQAFDNFRKEMVDKYGPTYFSKLTDEERSNYDELVGPAADSKWVSQVPDAPFKKTWHEFVFKRLVREAAEKGFDKIAWTTGEQQAERYDLSKQIDKIVVTDLAKSKGKHPTGGDTGFYLNATSKDGGNAIDRWVKDESELADYIGKEAAEKILKPEFKSDKYKNFEVNILENADLKIGGEGMKGFYDKILVDFANKFGKKYGAKVTDISVEGGTEKLTKENITSTRSVKGSWNIKFDDGVVVKIKESESNGLEDANKKALEQRNELRAEGSKAEANTVHSLEITPELKDAALNQGFALFQENKGSITFGDNRQFNINLFKTKDESTFLHETGHFFLEVLGDLANSNEQSKQDYDTLLKWFGVNSREEIETKHHEQFARGFESYLRTGEAPNSSLKKAFHTFRTWLMKVYQQASQLNVEVTPEVKSVFDRMFASDEQIQDLENNGDLKVMFGDPTSVGFNEAEAIKYNELAQRARDDARDKLQAELMQDVVKQQTKEYKETYQKIYDVEMAIAKEKPEFKAIEGIQGEYKLSTQVIDKQYEAFKDFLPPRSTKREGGLHPDFVAPLYGYENGQAMLQAIAPYRRGINDYVDTQTATAMKESYPQLLESPALSDEAIKVAHTESYRKLKRMELEFLAKEAKGLDKKIAEKLIRRMPKDTLVKTQAIKTIANTAVKDLKPHLYRAAEKRYSIEAAKNYKKGEYELAFEAKRKEYLNFEIYNAAVEAQEDVQKTVKKYKETFKKPIDEVAKTRDTNMVAAAKSILVNYGVIKDTKQKTADYIEKIKAYDPDTYSVINQLVIESTPVGTDYLTGNYNDFVMVKDTVDAIYDLAKSSNEILADGKLVQKQAVIDALSKRAEELSGGKELPGYNKAITDGEKRGISLLGLLARYRKVEHWARAFDGGDLNGSASAYLFRPVSDAQTRYELQRVEVQKQLEDAAKLLGKVNQKDISAPEIGYTFKDKQELLHALLHTGNESNYEKLLLGRKWGDNNLDNSLNDLNFRRMVDRFIKDGTLTKKDFDFVQAIWDINESLKPAAQKAHKGMYGYYFNEITAKPFSNAFGDYRGGYVPAIADKFMAFEQAPREAKALLEGFNNSYMFPTTGRGFTKERVQQYHAPLELNLQKISGHVNQVLKFTHIEPAVKGTAKILSDKSLVYSMAKVDSQIIGECLIPWLQRTAVQRLVQPGQSAAADKVFNALRRNSSMQFMALNVANWFQNTTGLFQVSTMVSPSHIMGAAKDYLLNPKTYADSILEKSDLMKTRVGDNVRDVSDKYDELVLQPTKFDKVSDAATQFAFFGEKISNGIIEQITWGSAYREQVSKGISEKEAVKYADSVVRQTLIDPTAAGSSSVQAGTPFARLFTMLSGFFFNSGNLLLTEWQIAKQMGLTTKAGGAKASQAFIMIAYAPAVVSALIMKVFAGKGLDEDDDGEYFDDAVDLLFSGPLRFLFAMVPGGTILNTTLNQFNNKPFDDKISVSPAIGSLENSIKAVGDVPKAMSGHGDPVKALKESLTAVGLVSGLPVGVLAKPITYIDKVEKGKAKPKNPIDYTRGLVTGK